MRIEEVPASSGVGGGALSVPPSLPPPVARFGKYDVLGRVAVGGMAEIFLARETLPGGALRQSALKIIKQTPSSEEDSRYFEELFLREGRTVVQLAHPHICHVYDIGREGEQFFIAMEWIEGRSLRDVLSLVSGKGELLPPAVAVGIAAQVASALDYAHAARDARGKRLNVVHRDVNPQNIMLRYDGAVKLVDFGVAQVSAEVDSRETTVKGKPSYMAPEQLLGQPVDARSDVFALGACLYEMLTGLRLHKRSTLRDTLKAVLQEPTPSLRSFVPDLSPELDAIVQRALAKRPEERFESAGALQAALEAYLAREGEVGSARRVGELMGRLYPHAHAHFRIDTSDEATACFSAFVVRQPWFRRWNGRGAHALWSLGAVLVVLAAYALVSLLSGSPAAPEAERAPAAAERVAPPKARTAPVPASTPALEPTPREAASEEAPAAAVPSPELPAETQEESIEPARPRRRRTSPGFVADPGF